MANLDTPQSFDEIARQDMKQPIIEKSTKQLAALQAKVKDAPLADLVSELGVDYDPKTKPMNVLEAPEIPASMVISNLRRENKNVSAATWDPYSKEGLARVRRDFVLIGLPAKGEDYYDKTFNQLAKAYDEPHLFALATDAVVERKLKPLGIDLSTKKKNDERLQAIYTIFRNPEENQEALKEIDIGYFNAWKIYDSVKFMITAQRTAEKAMRDMQSERTELPAWDDLGDLTKKIGKKAVEIWDNPKDNLGALAALTVTAIGTWWVGRNMLQKGSVWRKPLLAAGLLFGAVGVAKMAGYDVLHKIGAKAHSVIPQDYDGTPLEVLYDIFPEKKAEVSPATVLATLDIPLVSLYDAYEVSRSGEAIDPRKFFPGRFEYFEKYKPEDQQRVSKELFKMTEMLIAAYNKKYAKFGALDFEKAVKLPEMSKVAVIDFLMNYVSDIDSDSFWQKMAESAEGAWEWVGDKTVEATAGTPGTPATPTTPATPGKPGVVQRLKWGKQKGQQAWNKVKSWF